MVLDSWRESQEHVQRQGDYEMSSAEAGNGASIAVGYNQEE